LEKKIDILFGGGAALFQSSNLFSKASQNGYNVVQTLSDFNGNLKLPVLSVFPRIDFAIDYKNTTSPTLIQMVQKALSLLKQANKPFFLVIEGSDIDVTAHMNDIGANFREVEEYNEVMRIVLDFANSVGETLVVSTSDHCTGGLTLGRNALYNINTQYISQITHSIYYSLQNVNLTLPINQLVTNLEQLLGISLTSYTSELTGLDQAGLFSKLSNIMAVNAEVGWTTTGHTGEDVMLFSYGPGSNLFTGNKNNIDVAKNISSLLGLDLTKVTNDLKNFNPSPTNAKRYYDEYHN